MPDRVHAPQPPIFNLQAYSPAEIKEAVEKVGVKKANLPFLASFMLAIIGGGSIGFGALYYTIVASDAELSFATVRVVGGLVFSLGLALVLVGGAELFTGNNLIVMAWASGKVSTGTAGILLDRGCGRALQPHAGEDGGDVRITIRQIVDGGDAPNVQSGSGLQ